MATIRHKLNRFNTSLVEDASLLRSMMLKKKYLEARIKNINCVIQPLETSITTMENLRAGD